MISDAFQHNFLHPEIFFQDTNRYAQLDAYIPSLMVAFEYQGQQHYGHSTFEREDAIKVRKRDAEKYKKCYELGVTLVEVPYWWDGTRSQLEATIHLVRPDIIPISQGKPIPKEIDAPTFADRIPKADYIVTRTTGSPTCRGCGKKVPSNDLRFVARATSRKVSNPYKVQV
jgi:hypothetical protein